MQSGRWRNGMQRRVAVAMAMDDDGFCEGMEGKQQMRVVFCNVAVEPAAFHSLSGTSRGHEEEKARDVRISPSLSFLAPSSPATSPSGPSPPRPCLFLASLLSRPPIVPRMLNQSHLPPAAALEQRPPPLTSMEAQKEEEKNLKIGTPALAPSSSDKRIDQKQQPKKKYVKQVTGRHNDTELHLAARRGDLAAVLRILANVAEQMEEGEVVDKMAAEMTAVVQETNVFGETALFTAAEKGHLAVMAELLKYADKNCLLRKNRSGFDAFHVAVKEGRQDVVELLLRHDPLLSKTFGPSNTTPLISAASRGHTEVIKQLLAQEVSMVEVAKRNGKNALHFAARHGHAAAVTALLEKDPQLARRTDAKGQTALHMAAKGRDHDVITAIVDADPAIVMMPDKFGNTALHVATRKKRAEIVNLLLLLPDTHVNALTREHKTAYDMVDELTFSDESAAIREILSRHGALRAQDLNQPRDGELRRAVKEIKHDVLTQLEQSRKTNRNVHGIAKELRKLHRDGIANATNSVTVVAVLFASVAFASIFAVPGGSDDRNGAAVAARGTPFRVFFLSNAAALFTSLAVVVVQITVVRRETRAERRVVEVINKLMWLASVCTTVAFLSAAYIVVGRRVRWAGVLVTVIGGAIMAGVLAAMTYFVVKSKRLRRSRRREKSSTATRISSVSWHRDFSDSDQFHPVYAI
ncbi:hypothetical protein ZIOFF_058692 [Zingiber officinale]|uniref:PGG domain-containing protein n=2 Tax=Zingiber officinale TaxID=94328 RepID=A0A8J5F885_ZINOF|nr:hypothetical protein ZIOFF_058692 [Zingiber officinale]